jgi:hypothetical protein
VKYDKEIEEFVKGMPDGNRWAPALEAALEVVDEAPVPDSPIPFIREYGHLTLWYLREFKPKRVALTEKLRSGKITQRDLSDAEALDMTIADCGIRLMVARHQLIKVLKLPEDINFEELADVILRVGGVKEEPTSG